MCYENFGLISNYFHLLKKIPFALSGPFLVSRTGDAGCSERLVKCAKFLSHSRSHKEYIFIQTARRWSWKLIFAKECVTTHSPNENVSKMDGAKGKKLILNKWKEFL